MPSHWASKIFLVISRCYQLKTLCQESSNFTVHQNHLENLLIQQKSLDPTPGWGRVQEFAFLTNTRARVAGPLTIL